MNNLQRKNRPVILVVDDDTLHLRMVELYLEDRYEVCTATSVAGAVDLLDRCTVAMVLLDVSLAGRKSGLELCRFIRKSDQWQDIPIITLTAHVFPRDRKICLDAGCNDFMAKPIERDDLLKLMAKYLH